ncbi:16S rRNA (guanine(527)-N(7))-methyltransferase RsmG [Bdellovibrio svalbardensis]|uniref:Ribosomal RNA small subunit methyltransferase G n=1 Tax=Bdellovibrio svalbardensis TaxID=2972972 RepID=A0ABT6DKK4_9BACT|nr:16S rRNA (guanine(527)-N(7))-methyltransferase RsmG [Bdellovibrio svalbardensis]MDG0817392.1 16S rRNA (guanine(527)-N(7))-methyltransferase RsmG [Bdellovibrio svalbardensis]
MAHKNQNNYSPYKARQEERKKSLEKSGKKDGKAAPTAVSSNQGRHKKPETIYEVHEANDRLYDIFRNHSFDMVSHEQRLKLAHFYRLLMLNQEKENFTRLLKLKDIAIKHFIDSIIILKYTKLQFPLIDVGTGPGFPGIPLKIMFPEEKILLGEGVQRRVEFLKHVRSEMNLKNLDIVGRNINKNFVYPVNGVITRAVEDIGNTLGNVISCLQLGGRVYFMKGPGVDPEIEMAKKNWSEYYKLVENIAYSLPETPHDRRLVIYEKIKHMELPTEDEGEDLLLEELSGEEKRRWAHYK